MATYTTLMTDSLSVMSPHTVRIQHVDAKRKNPVTFEREYPRSGEAGAIQAVNGKTAKLNDWITMSQMMRSKKPSESTAKLLSN
jgi:hypothetical protein